MTEFKPIPDPAGALEPPRRYPPTAVGAATPAPEPLPRPGQSRRSSIRPAVLKLALLAAVGVPLLAVKLVVRAGLRLVHSGK